MRAAAYEVPIALGALGFFDAVGDINTAAADAPDEGVVAEPGVPTLPFPPPNPPGVEGGVCKESVDDEPADADLFKSARNVVAPEDIFVPLLLDMALTAPPCFEGGVVGLVGLDADGDGDPGAILLRGIARLTST